MEEMGGKRKKLKKKKMEWKRIGKLDEEKSIIL